MYKENTQQAAQSEQDWFCYYLCYLFKINLSIFTIDLELCPYILNQLKPKGFYLKVYLN